MHGLNMNGDTKKMSIEKKINLGIIKKMKFFIPFRSIVIMGMIKQVSIEMTQITRNLNMSLENSNLEFIPLK
jgi:hypothetical protein